LNERPGLQLAELLIAAGIAGWLNMEDWEKRIFILKCKQFISRIFFQVKSDLVLIEAKKVVTHVG
jgi:hypothetical protein